jgi:hypothetical protein
MIAMKPNPTFALVVGADESDFRFVLGYRIEALSFR